MDICKAKWNISFVYCAAVTLLNGVTVALQYVPHPPGNGKVASRKYSVLPFPSFQAVCRSLCLLCSHQYPCSVAEGAHRPAQSWVADWSRRLPSWPFPRVLCCNLLTWICWESRSPKAICLPVQLHPSPPNPPTVSWKYPHPPFLHSSPIGPWSDLETVSSRCQASHDQEVY